MTYDTISLDDAIRKANDPAEKVYIVTRIGPDTPLSMLAGAEQFIIEGVDNGPADEEKPRKQRKVDHGRIIALYKAGWSVPAIAADVGASEATVYNHINAEKKENETD